MSNIQIIVLGMGVEQLGVVEDLVDVLKRAGALSSVTWGTGGIPTISGTNSAIANRLANGKIVEISVNPPPKAALNAVVEAKENHADGYMAATTVYAKSLPPLDPLDDYSGIHNEAEEILKQTDYAYEWLRSTETTKSFDQGSIEHTKKLMFKNSKDDKLLEIVRAYNGEFARHFPNEPSIDYIALNNDDVNDILVATASNLSALASCLGRNIRIKRLGSVTIKHTDELLDVEELPLIAEHLAALDISVMSLVAMMGLPRLDMVQESLAVEYEDRPLDMGAVFDRALAEPKTLSPSLEFNRDPLPSSNESVSELIAWAQVFYVANDPDKDAAREYLRKAIAQLDYELN